MFKVHCTFHHPVDSALLGGSFISPPWFTGFHWICLAFVYLTKTHRRHHIADVGLGYTVLNETLTVTDFMELSRINSVTGKVDEIALMNSDKRYLREETETNEENED